MSGNSKREFSEQVLPSATKFPHVVIIAKFGTQPNGLTAGRGLLSAACSQSAIIFWFRLWSDIHSLRATLICGLVLHLIATIVSLSSPSPSFDHGSRFFRRLEICSMFRWQRRGGRHYRRLSSLLHTLIRLTYRSLSLHCSADVISTVEFDSTGNYLATGDKGGRVVLFERNDQVRSFGLSIILSVEAIGISPICRRKAASTSFIQNSNHMNQSSIISSR